MSWPLSFSHVPNYASSYKVKERHVFDLGPEEFIRDYFLPGKPLKIAAGAQHWKAISRWQDPDYLRGLLKNEKDLLIIHAPTLENRSVFSIDRYEKIKAYRAAYQADKRTFENFLSEAREPGPFLSLYSQAMEAGNWLGPLLSDTEDHRFFTPKHVVESIYPKSAVFFYRSSYTDWHYHRLADAFMIQVKGEKETLLYDPSAPIYDAMTSWIKSDLFTFSMPHDLKAEFERFRPWVAHVQPGDILFIPAWWWHAVMARDNRFGITVTQWFDPHPKRLLTKDIKASEDLVRALWKSPKLADKYLSFKLRAQRFFGL